MTEFLKGSFAGAFAMGCTYPLDTLKTRIQSQSRKYLYKNLFSGIASPMTAVVLEKALLFGAFGKIKHIEWTDSEIKNNFINGVNAGILTTFVVTPFERVKIKAQLNNSIGSIGALKSIIQEEGFVGLGRGWSATMIREVPGYGFYFSTLMYCQNRWPVEVDKFDVSNLSKQWLIGGVTGLVPWIFIYPSDIIKTTMQKNNWTMSKSIKSIYSQNGIKAFYRGYHYGLARAFFMHSFVILGYYLADSLFSY